MLHVHVLLVAPLGTGNVTQPGADQHQRRVPIRETADHPGPSPDFPIQSLNHIVRSDLCPMLRREVTIGQRFFETVLNFFRRFPKREGSRKGFLPFRHIYDAFSN